MSLSAQKTNAEDFDRGLAGAMPAGNSKSDLLTIYNDFGSVEHIWRRFEEVADCFAFQSFDFLETWYRHIGAAAKIDIQIVVVWDNRAKPRMILPLGIEKNGGLRRLSWLGDCVNDYNAPLLAPDFENQVSAEEFRTLWGSIKTILPAHDVVEFMRLPAKVGEQKNPFVDLDVSLNASGAHMTVLSNDFDAYYNEKRKSKAKKHFRSHQRKMEEIGELSYIHPETTQEIEASVEQLIAFKSDSLNAMGVRNFLENEGYVGFYKELAVTSGGNGLAHVSHLEIGGEYAAGNWGLVHKGRFYYLLASYNGPRFGRFSPGIFSLVETMRWATEQGVAAFDFTIGDEAYKREWCEVSIDLHDHLQATTLRGAVALLVKRQLLSMKRTVKQSPRLWKLVSGMRTKLFAK